MAASAVLVPRQAADYPRVQAAAAWCHSCRPAGAGRAIGGRFGVGPARSSQARSSMCMASRMAPSIRRSRSAGVMSPRSARSRKIAQVDSSAASTVKTLITVPTSRSDLPSGAPGPGRGFRPMLRPASANAHQRLGLLGLHDLIQAWRSCAASPRVNGTWTSNTCWVGASAMSSTSWTHISRPEGEAAS
jgi:hypothetical protein